MWLSLGRFVQICKVFIIKHRITVLDESYTNSFFFFTVCIFSLQPFIFFPVVPALLKFI